jgi:hypothetical protein
LQIAATPGVYQIEKSSAPRTGHFGMIWILPLYREWSRKASSDGFVVIARRSWFGCIDSSDPAAMGDAGPRLNPGGAFELPGSHGVSPTPAVNQHAGHVIVCHIVRNGIYTRLAS